MLRQVRWLLPVVILALSGWVGWIYYEAKRSQAGSAPKAAAPLPDNVSASFDQGWTWTRTEGEPARVKVRVRAKAIRMIKEPSNHELDFVEIELYAKDGETFDLVKSDRASFDTAAGVMYSEGEVEITKGLPVDAKKPPGRLVKIKSSGVRFDTQANTATSERATHFEMENAEADSTGATYDSNTREIRLHKDVTLHWLGKDGKRPMDLETGELIYKEADETILLGPWAKLHRQTFYMESGNAFVFLKEGAIDRVEAREAKGRDEQPGRRVDFDAKALNLFFTPKGEIIRTEGMDGARMVSTSAAAVTAMTADRVDLAFDETATESRLKKAVGVGSARIEAKPVPRGSAPLPDTRVLQSESIEMIMRAGGEEIEKVSTHAEGTLDFLPNRPGVKKRHLDAFRMTFTYGPGNRLDEFTAVTAKTRSEGQQKGKTVVTLTASDALTAKFDLKTGAMSVMEQWGNFTYEEGTRRAKANRARMDQDTGMVTLREAARVWDETGSTAADEIFVDQQAGTTLAKGNVNSTREPDKKDKSTPGLLDAGAAIQARAPQMYVSDDNRVIRYEGDALMWQGANRIRARQITIDKNKNRMDAVGNVVTQVPDAAQPGGKASARTSVVRAPEMTYTGSDKVAHYRGGVTLERQGMEVIGREMRAFFRDETAGGKTETKLDRAVFEQQVRIIERMPDRTRRGEGERAEYFLDEERMVLTGGNPFVNDSKRGISRGTRLEWLAKEDRTIVDNTGSGPGVTRIRK